MYDAGGTYTRENAAVFIAILHATRMKRAEKEDVIYTCFNIHQNELAEEEINKIK